MREGARPGSSAAWGHRVSKIVLAGRCLTAPRPRPCYAPPVPGLQVLATNRRWLADARGRPVWLTGSHHWDSLVDNGERPGGFDFTAYLDRLQRWGHSCLRLWAHEAWLHPLSHRPWARTGPGIARDGSPRFDLERLEPAYFERLRHRVALAGERGLQVIVMLFNGWSLHDNGEGDPWPFHPFHRDNNRNGIDGDPDGRGDGRDVHTLRVAAVTRLQERYAARVTAAVGDLPHVLWEVSNESPGSSAAWQRHIATHLRALDLAAGRWRPVGITSCFPGGDNRELFEGPADWVSPNRKGGWMRTPPPADGRKVVLLDTDHLWGIGGDAAWVWRATLRGHQVLYMDPLDEDPAREAARHAMGVARRLVESLDLASTEPRPDLASSGCCLADHTPGAERLLAWAPRGLLRLDLRGFSGQLAAEWAHHVTGETRPATDLPAGTRHRLRSPFAGASVLRLSRR